MSLVEIIIAVILTVATICLSALVALKEDVQGITTDRGFSVKNRYANTKNIVYNRIILVLCFIVVVCVFVLLLAFKETA